MAQGEAFANAGSDLFSAPNIGVLAVSAQPTLGAQPTPGQGIALAPDRQLPLAIRQLLPGYVFAYNEYQSNVSVTATSEGTANTVITAPASGSLTFDGATLIWVEFFCIAAVTSAVSLRFALFQDGTSLGTLGEVTIGSGNDDPIYLKRRFTPTAGAHTFSVRGYNTSAGTATLAAGIGGAGTNLPGYIMISKA